MSQRGLLGPDSKYCMQIDVVLSFTHLHLSTLRSSSQFTNRAQILSISVHSTHSRIFVLMTHKDDERRQRSCCGCQFLSTMLVGASRRKPYHEMEFLSETTDRSETTLAFHFSIFNRRKPIHVPLDLGQCLNAHVQQTNYRYDIVGYRITLAKGLHHLARMRSRKFEGSKVEFCPSFTQHSLLSP